MPVTILLEDGSRYSHEGKLSSPTSAVDPGTGSFPLRVVVPNPDDILLPGMYVRAVLGSGVRAGRASWCRSRGIARDPKGNATAMVRRHRRQGRAAPGQGEPHDRRPVAGRGRSRRQATA